MKPHLYKLHFRMCPEKAAKQTFAVWPELPPREPMQSGGARPYEPPRFVRRRCPHHKKRRKQPETASSSPQRYYVLSNRITCHRTVQKSLQTETTNQRTAAELPPNIEGRTVSPGTASNSNTVTRAFAWQSNRISPGAHTLSQLAGPLDGLILGTGFWAQLPAQIWDRVPCTSPKNGSEKVSPFRTQNETTTQQAILSHVPEKVAKHILAVWPELSPREPMQSGGARPYEPPRFVRRRYPHHKNCRKQPETASSSPQR